MAKISAPCSVQDCDSPVVARQLCRMHYQRDRKTRSAPCIVDGCGNRSWARGVCATHYDRAAKEGWRESLDRKRERQADVCSISDCQKKPWGHGWCSAHFTRWRRYGDPLSFAPPRPVSSICNRCGGPRVPGGRTGRMRCQPCVSAATKRWLSANPEAAKVIRKRRYAAHKDEWRQYAEENRERISRRTRQRRLANLEATRARERAANASLTDEQRARRLPVMRASAARYRARRMDAICSHGEACVTPIFLHLVRIASCRYCGEPAAHADHFVPLARGGLHCVENIVPACALCNTSKGSRLPDEWAKAQTEIAAKST